MHTKTLRSGGTTAMFIVGGAFLLASVGLAIGFTLAVVLSGNQTYLIGLLGALAAAVLGAVCIMLALRTGVRLHPDRVTWREAIGPEKSASWHEIAEVIIPGTEDDRPCVHLRMADGRVEPLRALSKPKQSETNRRWASRGYLERAGELARAHRDATGRR